MSNGDIPTVNLDGLGVVQYLECVGTTQDVWGCSPIGELVNLFSDLFAGTPTLLKTIEAQQRLAQSHLPQFQQLARNLQIWVNNGVPLSTGNPALRAQLQQWIHGTIYDSGLGLRVTPQGYNQFADVDKTLWQVFNSHVEEPAQALDTLVMGFQRVNQALDNPQPPPPAPPPGGPPPTGGPPPFIPTPCDSGNVDNDEVLDLCNAVTGTLGQILALLAGIQIPAPGGGESTCCINLVASLKSIDATLTGIWTTIGSLGSGGEPQPVDLTPVITALNAIDGELKTCLCRIANAFDEPITLPPVPDLTPPTVPKPLTPNVNAVLQQMIADGRLDPQLGQLITS